MIAVGLGALVWDLYVLSLGGHFKHSRWGKFRYGVDSANLGAVKTGVESYLSASLWTSVMALILSVPAVLLFGLPAGALASRRWTLPKLRNIRALRQA